jgi:hypothetical protein
MRFWKREKSITQPEMKYGNDAGHVGDLKRIVESEHHFLKWNQELEKTETDALATLVGALHTGMIQDRFVACRESAKAVLEARLTAELIENMTRLEKSASQLQWTAIGVTFIIGLVTIVGSFI